MHIFGLPGGVNGKEPACGRQMWVPSLGGCGKIPWRRVWQPTPRFLPGESYGQRNLTGYRP